VPCSTVEHGLGLPDDLVGRLVFGITVVVLGDVARADALLGGLRRKLPLIADDVRPPRYLELDVRRDEPSGRPGYRKGEHVTELSDDVIDQLVGETRQLPPEGQFFFLPVGGAVASRSLDHAAYGGRTPGWIAQTEVAWDDANSQDAASWASDVHARVLAPVGLGHPYPNSSVDETVARMRSFYGENWERVRRVKARVDPDNMLRSNQNIPPAD